MATRKDDDETRLEELQRYAEARRPEPYLFSVYGDVREFRARLGDIDKRLDAIEQKAKNGKPGEAPWWWRDVTARWILILLVAGIAALGGPPLVELIIKAWGGP